MEGLTFTRVKDEIYPQKQLVGKFFVSYKLMYMGDVEVRPITIKHLLVALIRNESRILYWRFVRMLYFLGFVEIAEYEAFSWKKNFRVIPNRRRIHA